MVKLLLKFNAAVIKEYPFTKNEMTIGRKPDNDIVIDNPAVSGHHARIVKQANDYLLEDLNSTNGTFFHDKKIMKAILHNQDQVAVAKHSIVFINEDEVFKAPAAAGPAMSSDATIVMAAPSSSGPKGDKKSEEKI